MRITEAELAALAAMLNTQNLMIENANKHRESQGLALAYNGDEAYSDIEMAIRKALEQRGVLPKPLGG